MAQAQTILAAVPATELTPAVRAALLQLTDENALLRASLADLRDQVTELEQVADSDTLTPLPNRRRFLRDLERVIGQATRHGTPAALVQVDIDGLHEINARHGQFAGDAALIHVARLLAGLIRTTDVAARLGGDAFGLILDHLDHNSAIDTAERIGRCIASNPVDLGGHEARLHATVGVATILAGDTAEEVLQRAERNLRIAKRG
jgi:diguanylate cyclase (GGDEF)-like protein